MVRIYSCEGNIGAGKTTLLSHIEKMSETYNKSKIVVLREPVDIWTTVCDDEGQNILEKFYKDPNKYAFPFQVLAFTTRIALIKKAINENPDCEFIICERSLHADGNIFAKMLYDDGIIDHLSYQIYIKMYENAISEFPLHGIIYLTASPKLCASRIVKRNRQGEENIKLDYLEKCSNYHEKWLNKSHPNNFRVIRIDEKDVDKFIESGNISKLLSFFDPFLQHGTISSR
jgi:deoxyadenosine/deoxycytidine kinase